MQNEAKNKLQESRSVALNGGKNVIGSITFNSYLEDERRKESKDIKQQKVSVGNTFRTIEAEYLLSFNEFESSFTS